MRLALVCLLLLSATGCARLPLAAVPASSGQAAAASTSLSPAWTTAAHTWFATIWPAADLDGSGDLSLAEMKIGMPSIVDQAGMAAIDTNHDGKVSLDEVFVAAHYARTFKNAFDQGINLAELTGLPKSNTLASLEARLATRKQLDVILVRMAANPAAVDTNGDSWLSEDEVTAFDGTPGLWADFAETRSYPGAGGQEEAIERVGETLRRDAQRVAVQQYLATNFGAIDTNHNGQIDGAELEACGPRMAQPIVEVILPVKLPNAH